MAGTVTSLGVIVTAVFAVETRYAKAEDVERLIHGQEQKIIWDLEENIDTSEGEDKEKWFKRLKEKVSEFCLEWPEEDECEREYLDDIEEELEE